MEDTSSKKKLILMQNSPMKIVSGIIILVFFVIHLSAQTASPVKVEQGLLQGVRVNDLTVYKGVPFAAPPVGELRWRAPQRAAQWKGIKQASQFAPAPVQGGNHPSGKSEDCLYLNVWTPAKSERDRIPVLVWIYGGGFSFGSTSEPVYNGENLARKGVVLVSISYRVGPLGFLAHPELSAENSNGVSGNYGLLDMIAGLEWIKKNVAAFGGDPNKVTIFGESAGGIAVSMLCASPLAKGLFHGAISQSGGSFGPPRKTTYPGENLKTLKVAEADGKEFAKKAGVASIKELREIAADSLPSGWGIGSSWPIIDGHVVPDDQYKLYESGRYNDVPVLIGYNSDEGLSFIGMLRTKGPKEYIESVRGRYGKFADALLKAYPVGDSTLAKGARDLLRDAAFGWHTWSWARLQSRTGKSSVYYYYFDQHPAYPETSPQAGHGSPHAQEIPFVFQHLDASDRTVSDSDHSISQAMSTYWTNFAKHGNPNGKEVPEWRRFNKNGEVMYFQQTPHLGPIPSVESLHVLDSYFAWRRSTEGTMWGNDN
jgi:para-nitrobenzyl esterase